MIKTLLLVLFATAQAGLGPNLVINPSFEKGIDGNNPVGWAKWSDGNTSGMFTWDNYGGRTFGKQVSIYAMRIDNMSSRGGYVSEAPIKVSDKKEYLLLGFLSGEKASGEIRFSVRFAGKEGSLGEVFSPAVSGSTGPQRGDWVVSAVRVRPPEGATQAYVVCRADYTAGAAWFDDIGFYELGGVETSEGGYRDEAFRSLGGKPRGHSEKSFSEAFNSEAESLEVNIRSLHSTGKFWQASAAALGQGRTLLGAGLSDISAGWTRRGWERLAESAAALSRARELARNGALRPDPLPGGVDRAFPLGVTIPLRQPTSGTEWAKLFREAASFGFTEATVDLPWALWESAEGRFDFSGVDAVFDAAEANGMTLYPQAGPKFRMTAGRALDGKYSLMGMPSWFLEKYPDSSVANQSKESISGVDGLFWELAFVNPAWLKTVPGWMAAWDRSLTALGGHAKGRRALGGWFLGDEPLLGQGPDEIRRITRPGLLGYNATYREAFGPWLKVRYGGSLEKLAAAWGDKAPVSFAKARAPDDKAILTGQVEPKKRYKGPAPWITDWLSFRASAVAGGLNWAGDRLSAASGVSAVAKLAPFEPVGPLDPEGLAADLFGAEMPGKAVAIDMTTDAIPFPLLTRAQDVGIGVARAAGNGAPLWLTDYCFRRGEMFGGENRADLLATPYVAPYVLSAVASGARGFFFRSWTSRPGVGSFAFPARQGKPGVALADEGLAVAKTARLLKVLAPWLNGASCGSPRYGVVFSWLSLLNDDPEAHHLMALLNVLALGGIHDVALVSEESLGKEGKVPYDVLFAPYATRMTRRGVESLKSFVKRGGVLVADTYIASVKAGGGKGAVLPWGLGEMFGLSAEVDGVRPTDAGNIGVKPQPNFSEWTGEVSFSLSMFSGGYRLRAAKGTEVLSCYLGAKPNQLYPAITVRKYGKGKAVVFPRIRHWPKFLAELEGAKLTRPEYRGLSMGSQFKMFNGVICSITMRKMLQHIGAAPQAMLVRAPVSSTFLDDQENWMAKVGIPKDELEHSKKMVRESQTGFPMISRPELLHLVRVGGIDLDEYAPVRVSMLTGKDGGNAVFVLSFSSMARYAEVTVPKCASVVDISTGEEFTAADGRVRMPLDPYQARVLALFQ
jgi:beta-galactosidase GanA